MTRPANGGSDVKPQEDPSTFSLAQRCNDRINALDRTEIAVGLLGTIYHVYFHLRFLVRDYLQHTFGKLTSRGLPF